MECGITTMNLQRQAQVDFSNIVFVESGGVLVFEESGIEAQLESAGEPQEPEVVIKTRRGLIRPRGPNQHDYLRKILTALRPGGRLAIDDQFQSAEGIVPRQWMYWTFLASMEDPNFEFGTTAELTARLEGVGFETLNEVTLPGRKFLTWGHNWVLIEAKVS